MRIVSLFPAATEWIIAFGAGPELVGRTHLCEMPAAFDAVPVVTSSAEAGGEARYSLNVAGLQCLVPDLIVTEGRGEASGVSADVVASALSGWEGSPPEVFALSAATFKQALDAALRLGRTLGRMAEAMQCVGVLERRLQGLRRELGLDRRGEVDVRPTVVVLDGIAPLAAAGRWIPDLVDHAGGRALLSDAGGPSRELSWDALLDADPDVLCVSLCGQPAETASRALRVLAERPGWSSLRAVRGARVGIFDGRRRFHRPGPGLYASIEDLAGLIHAGRAFEGYRE